jgi:hypothetical protein
VICGLNFQATILSIATLQILKVTNILEVDFSWIDWQIAIDNFCHPSKVSGFFAHMRADKLFLRHLMD